MPTLNAFGDKVIVEIISEKDIERKQLDEVSKRSGLLIPTAKDDPTKAYGAPVLGIVYALGPKAQEKFGDNIRVGDKVVYDEKNPHGFKWDDKKLLALTMDQIVARLERES